MGSMGWDEGETKGRRESIRPTALKTPGVMEVGISGKEGLNGENGFANIEFSVAFHFNVLNLNFKDDFLLFVSQN